MRLEACLTNDLMTITGRPLAWTSLERRSLLSVC